MLKDLIIKKDTDVNARNELVLYYGYLVDDLIDKYFKESTLDEDDVRSIGMEALIRAIDSYVITGDNPHQYFISHCKDNIFYAISHALEAHKNKIKYYGGRFEDAMLVDYGSYEDIIEKLAYSQVAITYIENLSTFDKNILKLYFGIGTKRCTDKEIAEIFGISRCVISKRRVKIIESLSKRLKFDNASSKRNDKSMQKKVDF